MNTTLQYMNQETSSIIIYYSYYMGDDTNALNNTKNLN